MSPSILNGHHIHDTLTSGLQIDIERGTYTILKNIFTKKEGERSGAKLEGKQYSWRISKDKFTNTPSVAYGNIESYSWLIHMFRPKDGEQYTTIGIKVSRENMKGSGEIKERLTLKANPTSLMRNDYAVEVSGVKAAKLLSYPFELLTEIAGKEFMTHEEWERIYSGDLALRDIEIAFPLILNKKCDKQSLIHNFTRIYGVRMSFKDKVMDIGDVLNTHFQRYPEDSTVSQSTGFQLVAKNKDKTHLFSLTMYDKIEEMSSRKKKFSAEDMKRAATWQDHLRVDIRVYPAFMKYLHKLSARENNLKGQVPEVFTINDWINLEKRPDFCKWLFRSILDYLEFPFLCRTVDEMKDIALAISKNYGPEKAKLWKSSVTYTARDLFEGEFLPKLKESPNETKKRVAALLMEWSRFLKKNNAPSRIGGLIFNMQNAFNFSSVLELKDLEDVFDIDDLSAKIKASRKNISYDEEKVEFREPILEFCNY